MLEFKNNHIDEKLADEQLYSLKILKTPHLSIYFARVMIIITGVIFICMFLPWQQNIRGQGRVTAINPANRPQTVQSIIPGQIERWYVREGQFVEKGDTLVEISETKDKYFDPEILTRTREQIDAKRNSLLAKELKKEAYQNQIRALQEALNAKLMQGRNKIEQQHLKIASDSIAVVAQEISFENDKAIYDRNIKRYESGNISLNRFQELESKYNAAKAKLVSVQNKFLQSKAELSIATTELATLQADYSEKISKTNSDLQATLSEINETGGEIAKMENEFRNIEVRRSQYALMAPQTGYLVQAMKAGIGETIKEGEAVATIQPNEPDLAVEMYVDAMDVPLITKGRRVRIQFDGWPALQFSGWPSVSVGTFGGIVQVIDRVETGSGKFRILVGPDPEDDPWPEQLRLGSGTKGWVMLENVMVWYEIWRQLNGFPPSLYENPGSIDDTKDKDGGKAETEEEEYATK